MAKHNLLEAEIEHLLDAWNKNCAYNQVGKIYVVTTGTRKKKVRFVLPDNSLQEGSIDIGELVLTESNEEVTKLLHRIEIPITGKIGERMNETQWKNHLYRSFLYECLGTFSVITGKAFDNHQIAEYDLDLDRLKGDETYKGIWIQVDNASEEDWFKVGDKYEVFTQTQNNNWGVYSYRTEHKNGIGQIPLRNAKLIKDERPIKEDIKIEKDNIKPIKIKKDGNNKRSSNSTKSKA